MLEINLKNIKEYTKMLQAGDRVLLTGDVYTARDEAHIQLFHLLDEGKPLPFELEGAVIYYTGPTPAGKNRPVGSCGPTTSARMDCFTPRLLDLGLAAMIGKGERSEEVCRAIEKNHAVYFCAVGGAGALMASHVRAAEEIAFPELGCESIKRLSVERLPVTVAIDSRGENIFTRGREKYAGGRTEL